MQSEYSPGAASNGLFSALSSTGSVSAPAHKLTFDHGARRHSALPPPQRLVRSRPCIPRARVRPLHGASGALRRRLCVVVNISAARRRRTRLMGMGSCSRGDTTLMLSIAALHTRARRHIRFLLTLLLPPLRRMVQLRVVLLMWLLCWNLGM